MTSKPHSARGISRPRVPLSLHPANSLARALQWLLVLLLPAWAASIAAANPTSDENMQTGDDGWKEIVDAPFTPAFDAVGYIKGYASSTSINTGEAITLFVSVNNAPDPAYSMSIYRLGYYQGHGGRLMRRYPASGYALGLVQPACPVDAGPPAGSGMVQCNRTPAYQFTIPTDWVSGIYVAKLSLKHPTANIPGYNYIVFAVRTDARKADIIYQQPVATYQAYNRYGGSSLYGCYGSACTAGRQGIL